MIDPDTRIGSMTKDEFADPLQQQSKGVVQDWTAQR